MRTSVLEKTSYEVKPLEIKRPNIFTDDLEDIDVSSTLGMLRRRRKSHLENKQVKLDEIRNRIYSSTSKEIIEEKKELTGRAKEDFGNLMAGLKTGGAKEGDPGLIDRALGFARQTYQGVKNYFSGLFFGNKMSGDRASTIQKRVNDANLNRYNASEVIRSLEKDLSQKSGQNNISWWDRLFYR